MSAANFAAPKLSNYDVVIAGGAVMGSSTAYWLTDNPDFKGRVLVIERDSTYHNAPSARAASCIRQQFSQPINVLISQFGVEFIRGFRERMQKHYPGEVAPDLAFKEHGFLYCWAPEHAEKARATGRVAALVRRAHAVPDTLRHQTALPLGQCR